MNQELKQQLAELKKLFLSGDITKIKQALETIKKRNDLELESELLEGVKYEEANDGGGYWTFSPNEYFTAEQNEEEPWTMESINGTLWYVLISLIGRSQCKTAIQFREQVTSLSLFGLQMRELPPEIGKFQNLTHLIINSISSNSPFGEESHPANLPAEIGNLTKLIYLDMGQNNMMGPPPEIKNLKNLETLLISSNQLTEIVSEVWMLNNLKVLKLDNNQLSNLPPEIGNLTKLETLEMQYNQLESLPSEIGKLRNLETLDLGGNPLTSLPPEISNLSKLTSFGLYDHRLTHLPQEISQLKHLPPDFAESFSPWLDGDVEALQKQFAEELEQEVGEGLSLVSLNLGSLGYPKAVSAWENLIVCSTENTISLWDAFSLELLWKDSAEGISLLSFSRDGNFFIAVSNNGFIRRYDVFDGEASFGWESETESMPTSLSLSHDEKYLAVCHQDGEGVIYIRSCSDGTLVRKIVSEDYEGLGYSGLSFSFDDEIVSAGDQDWSRIRSWNVKTGKSLDDLEVEGVQFCAVDYSVCGSYMFTGTVETPGSVWDTESKEEYMSLEDKDGITRIVAAHPTDGDLVATAAFEVLNIWNLESQESIAEFVLPERYNFGTLSFSSEGFVCALAEYRGFEEQKKESSHIVIASYEE